MKHVLLAMIASCSTLTAFQGLYVGGSLGGHLAEGAQSGGTLATFQTAAFPIDLQPNMFDRGMTGLFYGGYGIQWKALYLAAEGFAQFSSATLQSTANSNLVVAGNIVHSAASSITSFETCQGGIDFLPGWVPNPATLLYGRIGLSAAKATVSVSSANAGGGGGVAPWNLPVSISKTQNFTTLHAGAGLEQRLASQLTLRADYIFTDYGKLSLQGSASDTPGGNPVFTSMNGQLHLYDHAVLLGLAYRFSCQEPIYINPSCCASAYQGAYLGGTLGGGIITSDRISSIAGHDTAFHNFSQFGEAAGQLYNNQFQGMFFLGYGRSWSRGYLGGELFAAGATDTSMSFTRSVLTSNVAVLEGFGVSDKASLSVSSGQYGFDLRPGIILTPLTLFYGRVGVSAANVKIISTPSTFATQTDEGTSWSLAKNFLTQTWRATFRVGVGLEQSLTSKFHMRADYIFTNYGDLSFENTAVGTASDLTPVLLENTIWGRLQDNAIVIGLSYYFH